MTRRLPATFLLLAACAEPAAKATKDVPADAVVQTTVASGLAHPWDMAFLGTTDALVTEKDGTLRRVNLGTGEVASVQGVPSDLDNIRRSDTRDNSGLFGVVTDPDFAENRLVAGLSAGSLWRLQIDDDRVISARRLLEEAPIRLRNVRQGPDGSLYLLTDEANGRIIRIDRR